MLNIPLPASSDSSLASCLSLSPLCFLGVTVVCNLVCLGWPVVEIMESKSESKIECQKSQLVFSATFSHSKDINGLLHN